MYIVDKKQIQNIYDIYKDFVYHSFEGASIIDPSLDIGDILIIDGKKVIYQGNMEYVGKFKANISSKMQCKSKEETMVRIPSQATINRRVQSQINQEALRLTQLAEQTTEHEEKITQIDQDVESITQKVSKIADITRTVIENNEVHITEAMPIDAGIFKIYGNSIYFKYLYPSDDLYPSDNLYPSGECFTLCLDKQSRNNPSEELKKYMINLVDPLRNLDDIYDEFIVSDVDNIAKVIRRIGINKDGTLYILENEVEEIIGELELTLFEGENYLYIKEFCNLKYEIEYAILNEFTKQFATKVEVETQIKQTSEEINLNVNKKLEDYVTTTEMNSSIKQTSKEINLEVSKKVGEDEVISKINQTAEDITIDASRFNINGTVSANGNFKVDKNGIMICKNGTFTGGKIELEANGSDSSKFRIKSTNEEKEFFVTSDYLWMGAFQKSIKMNATDDISNPYIELTDRSYNTTKIESNQITTPKVTQTSLEKIKKNIEKANINALDIVIDSEIYTYNLKSEKDEDKKHFGFVIGEKYNTPSEVISDDEQGIDTYSMSSIMWKAIQELKKENEQLRKELEEVKNEKN